MLCSAPYRVGRDEFGCGKCDVCYAKRRRIWASRLMLEKLQHSAACFITLTFSDEHLPLNRSVHPRDIQLFMKRLRFYVDPVKIRYFGVGEYGERTSRPHYHLAIFGFSPVDHVSPRLQKINGRRCSCAVCLSWTFGGVHVGNVTEASMMYMLSYIVKSVKRTDQDDVRHPEFARMSLGCKNLGTGGIGTGPGFNQFQDFVVSKHGSAYIANNGDVPSVLRFSGRKMPLGRYIRRKLRSAAGMPLREPSVVAEVRRVEVESVGENYWMNGNRYNTVQESKRCVHRDISVARSRIDRSKKGGFRETS